MIPQRRRVFCAALEPDDGFGRRERQALPPKLAQRMVAARNRMDGRERRSSEKLRIPSGLSGPGRTRPIRQGRKNGWGFWNVSRVRDHARP